jgi:hypothetical protein
METVDTTEDDALHRHSHVLRGRSFVWAHYLLTLVGRKMFASSANFLNTLNGFVSNSCGLSYSTRVPTADEGGTVNGERDSQGKGQETV